MAELTSGINDLIQRIKEDGVAKGKAEHERLLGEAQDQAARILSDARAEADALKARAEEECETLKRRTESEMRLAVRDFVAEFGDRIRARLIQPTIAAHVTDVLKDPEFLKQALSAIAQDMIASGGGSLEVVVSPEHKEQLGGYFTQALTDRLKGIAGMDLGAERGMTGFRLRREGEAFTWDFTLDAVVGELARLVEPELRPFFNLDHRDRDA